MAYQDTPFQLIVSAVLIFLIVNFDPNISSIFFYFSILSIIFYLYDLFLGNRNIEYPTERVGGNRIRQLLYAVGIYIIFVISSNILLNIAKFVGEQTGSGFSVFNEVLFQSFANASPALADTVLISLIMWAVIIPIVETHFFFGRVFEFIKDLLHVNGQLNDIRTWSVILLVSVGFMLFHITAKGVSNSSALLLVFLFALTSIITVIIFKQTIEAILIHIIANSFALINGLGLSLLSASVLLIYGVLLAIHLYPVWRHGDFRI